MKKAHNSKGKKLIFLGLLSMCLVFFNLSCGLDVIDLVLEDAFVTESTPDGEGSYDSMTFNFSTKKLLDNEYLKGYVYYKIYNNAEKKNSEIDQLNTMIADSSRRYNSYTLLMENFCYKPLHYLASNGTEHELELDNADRNVSIRLTNYQGSEGAYAAKIQIGNSDIGIPLRHNGKNFDFGRSGEDRYELPVKNTDGNENDTDIKGLSEDPEQNITDFYVVLYGIYYAPNDTFERVIYSPIHYLGHVKINSTSEDN